MKDRNIASLHAEGYYVGQQALSKHFSSRPADRSERVFCDVYRWNRGHQVTQADTLRHSLREPLTTFVATSPNAGLFSRRWSKSVNKIRAYMHMHKYIHACVCQSARPQKHVTRFTDAHLLTRAYMQLIILHHSCVEIWRLSFIAK